VFGRLNRLRGRDPRFEPINLGLGAEAGEVDFEENAFTGSSSMLGISSAGLEAFPFTSSTRKIRIPMTTLDHWTADRSLETPIIVKMDVQGFEDQVIRGGERSIRRCQAVISEVSFVALYEGQPLFGQIHQQMSELGFRLAGMIENVSDPNTGEILQADAIFVARDL
ncbi:MAG: FkbM family methyltransferase, partial [Terriglobia bacterium]